MARGHAWLISDVIGKWVTRIEWCTGNSPRSTLWQGLGLTQNASTKQAPTRQVQFNHAGATGCNHTSLWFILSSYLSIHNVRLWNGSFRRWFTRACLDQRANAEFRTMQIWSSILTRTRRRNATYAKTTVHWQRKSKVDTNLIWISDQLHTSFLRTPRQSQWFHNWRTAFSSPQSR